MHWNNVESRTVATYFLKISYYIQFCYITYCFFCTAISNIKVFFLNLLYVFWYIQYILIHSIYLNTFHIPCIILHNVHQEPTKCTQLSFLWYFQPHVSTGNPAIFRVTFLLKDYSVITCHITHSTEIYTIICYSLLQDDAIKLYKIKLIQIEYGRNYSYIKTGVIRKSVVWL